MIWISLLNLLTNYKIDTNKLFQKPLPCWDAKTKSLRVCIFISVKTFSRMSKTNAHIQNYQSRFSIFNSKAFPPHTSPNPQALGVKWVHTTQLVLGWYEVETRMVLVWYEVGTGNTTSCLASWRHLPGESKTIRTNYNQLWKNDCCVKWLDWRETCS